MRGEEKNPAKAGLGEATKIIAHQNLSSPVAKYFYSRAEQANLAKMGGSNKLTAEQKQGYLFSIKKYTVPFNHSACGEQQNPPLQLELFPLDAIIQRQIEFDNYKSKPQQMPC